MSQLQYYAPGSVEDAVKALGAGGRAMSGGTDLLVQLRAGRLPPGPIVDLKNVAGTQGIRQENGGWIIGAATPAALLGEHAGLVAAWPGVVEGAGLIGSTQIQNRASLAGNLCNASPAADSVPALIAARATCIVAGPGGRREVPVQAIVTGVGKTSLGPGEFVLEIRLPPRPPRAADAYLRAIPRTEMDIAVAGAGADIVLDEAGVCQDVRVVLGAVAPTAVIVAGASAALVGFRLDEAALERLDSAAQVVCRPISDKRGTVEYRTRIAGVLARRAVAIAWERAEKRA
ncbi:carbon-monoxide dehydrogenase medium subunit [Caulobacter ginsengisoli]|uniref:Carbon-monoxide dehydrogenase medium subunit n=1 Tax=Caulobacter ginsengisoli TaxID=400775 RepID=A0ABU0IPE4_9CAUL|nr:xanthine dehydrogenase family protein subunit M [Caulobacter ginsengisoli]MDQ0463869.1 carbon-monoxide dehydrogenase medium subunit [Caulobacter ginsengisoli]